MKRQTLSRAEYDRLKCENARLRKALEAITAVEPQPYFDQYMVDEMLGIAQDALGEPALLDAAGGV